MQTLQFGIRRTFLSTVHNHQSVSIMICLYWNKIGIWSQSWLLQGNITDEDSGDVWCLMATDRFASGQTFAWGRLLTDFWQTFAWGRELSIWLTGHNKGWVLIAPQICRFDHNKGWWPPVIVCCTGKLSLMWSLTSASFPRDQWIGTTSILEMLEDSGIWKNIFKILWGFSGIPVIAK